MPFHEINLTWEVNLQKKTNSKTSQRGRKGAAGSKRGAASSSSSRGGRSTYVDDDVEDDDDEADAGPKKATATPSSQVSRRALCILSHCKWPYVQSRQDLNLFNALSCLRIICVSTKFVDHAGTSYPVLQFSHFAVTPTSTNVHVLSKIKNKSLSFAMFGLSEAVQLGFFTRVNSPKQKFKCFSVIYANF